jgi:hypothetical protein
MFSFILLKNQNNLKIKFNKRFLYFYINSIFIKKFQYLSKLFFNFNFFNQFCFTKRLVFISFLTQKNIFHELLKLKKIFFSIQFLFIRIFKAHGINMRIISLRKRLKTNLLFLRLGFSHGLVLKLPNSLLFRVFKRRYFFFSTFDENFLNNITYHLCHFRRFFQYKLIGIKLIRDNLQIKIGKKKSF